MPTVSTNHGTRSLGVPQGPLQRHSVPYHASSIRAELGRFFLLPHPSKQGGFILLFNPYHSLSY
jgi:hypothetical protein